MTGGSHSCCTSVVNSFRDVVQCTHFNLSSLAGTMCLCMGALQSFGKLNALDDAEIKTQYSRRASYPMG